MGASAFCWIVLSSFATFYVVWNVLSMYDDVKIYVNTKICSSISISWFLTHIYDTHTTLEGMGKGGVGVRKMLKKYPKYCQISIIFGNVSKTSARSSRNFSANFHFFQISKRLSPSFGRTIYREEVQTDIWCGQTFCFIYI